MYYNIKPFPVKNVKTTFSISEKHLNHQKKTVFWCSHTGRKLLAGLSNLRRDFHSKMLDEGTSLN